MSIKKKRNFNHFVGSLNLMLLCAPSLCGALCFQTQASPLLRPLPPPPPPPQFYFVHWKQFCYLTLLSSHHAWCVYINMDPSVTAIVCTKICCVRCTDLINRYCRVLFKDRWSISETLHLCLCYWGSSMSHKTKGELLPEWVICDPYHKKTVE